MPRFLGPLRAELVGTRNDRPVWRLLQPLAYANDRLQVVAPEGFETDFASVPRLPLAYLLAGDTAHGPAVIHDYLYRTNGVTRREADAVFYEAMGVSQPELGFAPVPVWRRWIMWAAVRAGAGATWRRYREAEHAPA